MSEPSRESRLVVVLRAFVLVVAAATLLFDITSRWGMFSGAIGAGTGAVLGGYVARSRARLPVIWLAGIAIILVAMGSRTLLVDRKIVPALFGLHSAFALTEVVSFGLLAFAVALVLRVSAARVALLSIAELATIAVSLAGAVAAHRDGAINRPRALTDWAWTNGYDPVHILLWIGASAFVALFFASLKERKGRSARVFLHAFAIMAAAALLLVVLTRNQGLIHPREAKGGLFQDPKGDPKGGKGEAGNKPPPQGSSAQGQQPSPGESSGQGQSGKGQTGQGAGAPDQNLEFREDYSSSDKEGPVAVVILHDDYVPPRGYYYFRQTAFSQYNGTRLVAHTMQGMDDDILKEFPSKVTAVPGAPSAGEARSLVHTTVALLIPHPTPFGLEAPAEFTPRPSSDPSRFVREYDVTSAAFTLKPEDLVGHEAGLAHWAPEAREAYLRLPDDARYKVLAEEIVTKTLRPNLQADPFAQAIAISAWMGKNATYSLKSKHAGGTDPTGDFLFGDKIGYCVHFAHSVTYLLRARGLPARVAAGYAVEEGRRGTGSAIMIEAKDAHAWAEIYLEKEGWIVVDVAPERTLDPPRQPPDQDLQRALGEMARGDKQAGKAKESPVDDEGRARLLARLRLTAMLLGALLVLTLYGVKLWRRVVPYFASPRHIYRVAYRAALDRLSEAGWVREPSETREHFAARVGAIAPTMEPLTREHLGRAFGARNLSDPAEIRRLSMAAGTAAQKHAALWRVILGILNPLSWTRTR